MAPYYTPLAYKCKGNLSPPRNGPAHAADVVSSNIVGYNKVSVTVNAFDILGSQFTAIGDHAIDIQDLFSEGLSESDNLLFFNGTGYDSYTYFELTFDEDWNELGAGWQDDATGFRATRSIAPGEAFWIKPVETKTMTFSGEVSTSTTYTFNGGNMNKLVAIPVPEKIDLQDVTFQNIAESDSIQIYNGSGYDSYTYFDLTFDEDWNELGAGWQDDSTGFRSDKEVDLGKGFWIKAANNSIEIGL